MRGGQWADATNNSSRWGLALLAVGARTVLRRALTDSVDTPCDGNAACARLRCTSAMVWWPWHPRHYDYEDEPCLISGSRTLEIGTCVSVAFGVMGTLHCTGDGCHCFVGGAVRWRSSRCRPSALEPLPCQAAAMWPHPLWPWQSQSASGGCRTTQELASSFARRVHPSLSCLASLRLSWPSPSQPPSATHPAPSHARHHRASDFDHCQWRWQTVAVWHRCLGAAWLDSGIADSGSSWNSG